MPRRFRMVLAGLVFGAALGAVPRAEPPRNGKAAPLSAHRLRSLGHESIPGIPWTGGIGIRETTEELMARERAAPLEPRRPAEAEPVKIRPERRDLPQNPNSPDVPLWPSGAAAQQIEAQGMAEALDPQRLGLSFTGATLADTAAFPPDSMGAAGPTQYLVGVNGRIRVFDKSTGSIGALNMSMNLFFDSVRNGFGTSDPRVRYDRLSGRWFVLIINVSTPNRVLLAVSNGPTITGSTVWTFFFFQQNLVSPPGDATCLADYPTLGIDANALYIGVNQFCPGFGGTTAFVVRKSSVLGAGPIVVSAFRNLTGTPTGPGPYTPQGVDNFDPSPAEGYFIGVDNATFGTLMLRRISNPAGTPTLSGNIMVTVSATSFPISVRHRGNTNGVNGQLDGIDDRLFDAVLRNGRLWTSHNIAVNNTGTTAPTRTRNAIRWYELADLSTATPRVVQSGTLFAATPTNTFDERNYWMPSIMISGQGHAALGMSIAGTNEFANAATIGRLAEDPLGTLQAPVAYTASSTAYNPPGDTGDGRGLRRWGDYSYTSLDPCDDMTMWTIQEFCDATNSYGVRVVRLLAPFPATPTAAAPATVAPGQSSVNVIVTGTRINGSGFYDPGPGFACRIGATVSGGVAVNSVSFVNPTTVTLNISTIGASLGPKTVTVINPDGQSVTSASGLLTVTEPAPAQFYTVSPCRILDTRNPDGPFGGPALVAGASRTFTIAGQCGLPPTARNVSANVTVTAPTAPGHLTIHASGTALPFASVINFRPGQTRANNGLFPLGAGGTLEVFCGQPPGGTVHFIIDVNGYFR